MRPRSRGPSLVSWSPCGGRRRKLPARQPTCAGEDGRCAGRFRWSPGSLCSSAPRSSIVPNPRGQVPWVQPSDAVDLQAQRIEGRVRQKSGTTPHDTLPQGGVQLCSTASWAAVGDDWRGCQPPAHWALTPLVGRALARLSDATSTRLRTLAPLVRRRIARGRDELGAAFSMLPLLVRCGIASGRGIHDAEVRLLTARVRRRLARLRPSLGGRRR